MLQARPTLPATVLLAALVLWLLPVDEAAAEPVRTRVLRGLQIARKGDRWQILVQFNVPIRYVRHDPLGPADTARVQIDLLAREGLNGAAVQRESLPVVRQPGFPLTDVTYEGDTPGGPFLELEFAGRVAFQIRPGTNGRSIAVEIPVASARPSVAPKARTPAPPAPPAALPPPRGSTAPGDPVAEHVRQGRTALEAGDLDAAVRAFTKALTLPESDSTREAKELLGVARERKGQLAHAKAEYEEYLERYPDGPDSDRVRQRLVALITSREEPPAAERRATTREVPRFDFDFAGSASTYYRREEHFPDAAASVVADDSIFTDLNVVSHLRAERFDLRSQVAGSYRYGFLPGDDDDARVSALLIEGSDRERRFSGSLGRQVSNTGGVLGRFDGLRLSYRFADHWSVSAVGGLPVELFETNSIRTDRIFYGVSLDLEGFLDRMDAQVFAIRQTNHGLVDRTAVGGELRYFDATRYAAAYVDYDVHFQSLNTAFLTGNWQILDSLALNLLADYRNTPVLTTTNALIGQPVTDIQDLRLLFGTDDLEALAVDRTTRAATGSIGLTWRFAERWQLAGDVTASHLSGTPASGGVEALEGTGLELAYFVQVIGSSLLVLGDTGSLGVRYFDGSLLDVTSLIWNARYPVWGRVRLGPSLRVDYRQPVGASDSFSVRPTLRADVRVGRFVFDSELGGEWTDAPLFAASGDELGYIASLGVRMDF